MRYLWYCIVQRLYLRSCRGCADQEPHSHHLTRLGHWHYVARYREARR